MFKKRVVDTFFSLVTHGHVSVCVSFVSNAVFAFSVDYYFHFTDYQKQIDTNFSLTCAGNENAATNRNYAEWISIYFSRFFHSYVANTHFVRRWHQYSIYRGSFLWLCAWRLSNDPANAQTHASDIMMLEQLTMLWRVELVRTTTKLEFAKDVSRNRANWATAFCSIVP